MSASEDAVTFTVNLDASSDDVQRQIDAAVEARIKQLESELRKQVTTTTGGSPTTTTTGGRGLISTYGYGNEPRKHYKPKRQPRRGLPATGTAPFASGSDTVQGFGGTSYVAPRGFQQEKVARRGNVRRNYANDQTSISGIRPESIRESIRNLQLQQAEFIQERQESGRRALDAVQQYSGAQSDLTGNLMQTLSSPEGMAHAAVMSTLSALSSLGAGSIARDMTSKAAIGGTPDAASKALAEFKNKSRVVLPAGIEPSTSQVADAQAAAELKSRAKPVLPKGVEPTAEQSARAAAQSGESALEKAAGTGANAADRKSMLKNPKQWHASSMLGLLSVGGPYGMAIAAAIAAIVALPQVAKQIIQLASKKGGPLNRDFLIDLKDAVTGFMSYTDQYKRDLGLSGFVVSQHYQYGQVDGTTTGNSMLDADEFRINKIPLDQR